MASKEIVARVYDDALINAMADTVDATKTYYRGLGGCKNVPCPMAQLVKAAELVDHAKEIGYSQEAAEGLLNQGVGRAYVRKNMVNGATGTDKPSLPEAHVKFDGPRDRRRQRRQDEAIGNKYAIPASFWEAENEGGLQEFTVKANAADTGEWFG